jgi:hypothetical protein
MPSANVKAKMKNYMQEAEIVSLLEEMSADTSYNTQCGHSIDTDAYPDNEMPFVDVHLRYLAKHPHVDPANYLSNLRLMLKIR